MEIILGILIVILILAIGYMLCLNSQIQDLENLNKDILEILKQQKSLNIDICKWLEKAQYKYQKNDYDLAQHSLLVEKVLRKFIVHYKKHLH